MKTLVEWLVGGTIMFVIAWYLPDVIFWGLRLWLRYMASWIGLG